MNGEHLRQLTPEAKVTYVSEALPERDHNIVAKLAPIILERAHTKTAIQAADEAGEYDWAFTAPAVPKSMLQWKQDDSPEAAQPRLEQAVTLLAEADFDSPDSIKATLWSYAEEVGKGQLLWPLRVALTGQERSPDPFTCAYVLGKTETLHRLQSSIELLS